MQTGKVNNKRNNSFRPFKIGFGKDPQISLEMIFKRLELRIETFLLALVNFPLPHSTQLPGLTGREEGIPFTSLLFFPTRNDLIFYLTT